MNEIQKDDLFMNKLHILWKMHPRISFGCFLEELTDGNMELLKSDEEFENIMNDELRTFYKDMVSIHLMLDKSGKILAKADFASVSESVYIEMDVLCQKEMPDIKKIHPNQRLLTIHMFEEDNIYHISAKNIRAKNSVRTQMIYDAAVICQIEFLGEKIKNADVEKMIDNYVDDVKEYEGDEIKEILQKFIDSY